MTSFTVSKQRGRLHIVDGDSRPVYTPPDFIRDAIRSRSDLERLAGRFNEAGGRCIDAIVGFEAEVRRYG